MNWLQVSGVIITGAGGLGVMFLGFGYFVGQLKKGRSQGELDTLELAEKRRELQDQRINDLQQQLNDSKTREDNLAKRIEALEAENKTLRDVVTMTTIPQPLQDFVSSVANKNYEAIGALKDQLRDLPRAVADAVMKSLAAQRSNPDPRPRSELRPETQP